MCGLYEDPSVNYRRLPFGLCSYGLELLWTAYRDALMRSSQHCARPGMICQDLNREVCSFVLVLDTGTRVLLPYAWYSHSCLR